MESIYWVVCWACHRKCAHCYDDRFRPYVRGKLEGVVAEAEAHWPRIVANLPPRMRYRTRPRDGQPGEERIGRIILAGGELLVDPVRERVLYPLLEALRARYGADGARIVLQTTGDLLDEAIIRDLVARGVWLITCAGFDDFHVGMEAHRRAPLVAALEAAFSGAGVERVGISARERDWLTEDGPFWTGMGAVEGSWIGELWPRGRAWENGLSSATIETNFCARQSGARRFLEIGQQGSEVAIEPDGSLYPCCLKTKRPLGSVAEEPLLEILESLRGHPVFEALNRGAPDEMGLGITPDAFRDASHTIDPKGRPYANLCIGCDRFFEERLGPVIVAARERRTLVRRAREGLAPAVA